MPSLTQSINQLLFDPVGWIDQHRVPTFTNRVGLIAVRIPLIASTVYALAALIFSATVLGAEGVCERLFGRKVAFLPKACPFENRWKWEVDYKPSLLIMMALRTLGHFRLIFLNPEELPIHSLRFRLKLAVANRLKERLRKDFEKLQAIEDYDKVMETISGYRRALPVEEFFKKQDGLLVELEALLRVKQDREKLEEILKKSQGDRLFVEIQQRIDNHSGSEDEFQFFLTKASRIAKHHLRLDPPPFAEEHSFFAYKQLLEILPQESKLKFSDEKFQSLLKAFETVEKYDKGVRERYEGDFTSFDLAVKSAQKEIGKYLGSSSGFAAAMRVQFSALQEETTKLTKKS